MPKLCCPACQLPLCARIKDPWEIIRALAAAHLRICPKSTRDRREIGTLAIEIADAAVDQSETKG